MYVCMYVCMYVSSCSGTRQAVQDLLGSEGSLTPVRDADDDEEGYFASYSHYKIHEDMLKVLCVLHLVMLLYWSI